MCRLLVPGRTSIIADIEPGQIIRHDGGGNPTCRGVQELDAGFPPSEWKLTRWGGIRRSRKRTGHVPPGLAAINGTEHRNGLCWPSTRSPTGEYPAVLSIDEGHLLESDRRNR